MRAPAALIGAILTGALLAGCAGDSEAGSTASPTPTAVSTPTPASTPAEAVDHVATAKAGQVTAYTAPDGEEIETFANPIDSGAPLVFHVEEEAGDWIRVQLPIRPNGTTGWVRSADVALATLRHRIEVSTTERTVTLLTDGEPVKVFDAAIGTGDTPTPTGRFYITELLAPTNDGYGPYAYGLSAFSDVLNSFGGGPGQIGMHGTPDESSIGQEASHGCIRLRNEDITYLAEILPLGTPVTIS